MLDKQTKKLNAWDIGLIKIAVAAFILFVITVWPAAMNLVHSIHWGWFLAIAVVAGFRPALRFWKK